MEIKGTDTYILVNSLNSKRLAMLPAYLGVELKDGKIPEASAKQMKIWESRLEERLGFKIPLSHRS